MLVCSGFALLTALPILLFPRSLPQTKPCIQTLDLSHSVAPTTGGNRDDSSNDICSSKAVEDLQFGLVNLPLNSDLDQGMKEEVDQNGAFQLDNLSRSLSHRSPCFNLQLASPLRQSETDFGSSCKIEYVQKTESMLNSTSLVETVAVPNEELCPVRNLRLSDLRLIEVPSSLGDVICPVVSTSKSVGHLARQTFATPCSSSCVRLRGWLASGHNLAELADYGIVMTGQTGGCICVCCGYDPRRQVALTPVAEISDLVSHKCSLADQLSQ
ncbi:unnamed protein product [Protopolystoma xenopodis]|uniref:Uncharacterized protein n=1 Tax=Protopolystoma xenopodis TaxID=117903 RepID=A0A3S4ZE46_9PLAT|nr:unnamed protein product [Protopolystoma xenopodis]